MRALSRSFTLLVVAAAFWSVSACTSTPEPAIEVKEDAAYARLKDPTVVKVMPVILPKTIEGSKDPGDEDKWRLEWPSRGANIVSDAIVDGSGGRVTSRPVKDKPDDGWYVEVNIIQLDVGDAGKRTSSAFSSENKDGWSRTVAECRIIDAKTGEVAARVTIEHRTGSVVQWCVPFENDMDEIGERLGAWLDSK